MLLQDKASQLLLNVWLCVSWDSRIEHLRNRIVGTCRDFLQSGCMAEWAPALFTVMWLLSRVVEQMLGKVYFLGWRVVASFAFIWLF